MRKLLCRLALLIAFFEAAFAAEKPPEDLAWLFPLVGPAPASDPSDIAPNHVPGSHLTFTGAQIHDLKHAVDWFPSEHPTMPGIVAAGHGNANACGFCHLATGNGRPENSALAGLSADYIERQVSAFANGSRRAAIPTAVPGRMMTATANAVTSDEVEQAAAYFSKLPYRSYIKVVETTELGFQPIRFVYVLRPGPREPIGERIIEVPVDAERFERRDPHTRYVAYVPSGSIAAGRTIAADGGPARQPCGLCHGDGLRGGIAPPLAGRSPTMLVRQLAAFRAGTRATPEATPMRAIAAALDNKAMIAVSAYAATLKP